MTRDFGARPLLERRVGDVAESDTVMRVLERSAEISTRYGGGFVQSIDGLEAERRDGRSWDWLYYVDGVEAGVGAAEYELRGGEAIWWDYRDWSAVLRVPAVVGSWPQPFAGGYEGRRHPTVVECRGGGEACAVVRARLEGVGAEVMPSKGAIRVLVGPWAQLRRDPAAAVIEAGPAASGVYADFVWTASAVDRSPPDHPISPQGSGSGGEDGGSAGAFRLIGLDEGGEPARRFGPGAGLVAATRRGGAPPVWVVTGTSAAGVRAAARLLRAAALGGRFAVATEDGESTPLPLR